MTEAEKLLAELTEDPHYHYWEDAAGFDRDVAICNFCGVCVSPCHIIEDVSKHNGDCSWRRAKEYLEGRDD